MKNKSVNKSKFFNIQALNPNEIPMIQCSNWNLGFGVSFVIGAWRLDIHDYIHSNHVNI